jgi:hypothetical protein
MSHTIVLILEHEPFLVSKYFSHFLSGELAVAFLRNTSSIHISAKTIAAIPISLYISKLLTTTPV